MAATKAVESAETRANRAAILLKHVGERTRLQILLMLSEKDRNVGEMCVGLGNQSQPGVSHHLALLRHASIIEPTRSGKNNIYRLTEKGRLLVGAVEAVLESA